MEPLNLRKKNQKYLPLIQPYNVTMLRRYDVTKWNKRTITPANTKGDLDGLTCIFAVVLVSHI